MKKILAFFLVAFASCAYSVNTLIAIVNTIPITLNLAQINLLEVNEKDEQILVINNFIDNILQVRKATELAVTPTKRDIENVLNDIAQSNNLALKENWLKVVDFLEKLTTRRPDVNTVLYTIGVQELGKGIIEFSKDDKQNLIHIGTCSVLNEYYEYTHRDEDGWPHFELLKNLPAINSKDQEHLIKEAMLDYFLEHQYYNEIKDLVSD